MFVSAYADSLYATQLQASTQATGSSRCRLLGDCERQLLNDAVAAPLFTQQKRLLIAPDIRNIIFAPFGPVLDLTYTTKNDVKKTLKSRCPALSGRSTPVSGFCMGDF